MFNTPRALGGFPILALHPKSLRQIGSPWFFRNELRKRVRTSHVGGSFCVGNRQRLTLAYVEYASTLCFACATFLAPKSLRQIGSPAVFSERTPEAYANLSCGRFVLCGERITVDSRVCRIRFDPLFRLRHVFSSKMDSLAWLRYAGAGHANLRGGKSPAAIGKANAPTPKTSDSKFDSLRGKMLTHFILPESLIL